MGFPFAVPKHVRAAPANAFLGVVSDLTFAHSQGFSTCSVSERRRDKLLVLMREARTGLPPMEAAVLVGKLFFTTTWLFGGVGTAALQPTRRRAALAGSPCIQRADVSPAIERSLAFFEALLGVLPPRVVWFVPLDREPVVVYTDASYEVSDARPAAGGFVYFLPPRAGEPRRAKWGFEYTSPDLIARWGLRKQYIGVLEQLYSVSPYTSCPSDFEGADVLHFIDNTGAVAGNTKGYATAYDAGLIVNALSALNVRLRARIFFEYVRSKANVAGLPSRPEKGLTLLQEVLARLGFAEGAERIELHLPAAHSWDAPARSWLSVTPPLAEGQPTRVTPGSSSLSTALLDAIEPLARRTSGLVCDVLDGRPDALYVGCNPRHGPTGYGNPFKASREGSNLEANQRAIDKFVPWLLHPEQANIVRSVHKRLRGRCLACHCASARLPCHASILAALADASAAELAAVRAAAEESIRPAKRPRRCA
jgi:hypothetical protein